MNTAPLLVGLGLALVWITLEIQGDQAQEADSERTHTVKQLASIDTTDMMDSSMPRELNQFLSRKRIQTGNVIPMTAPAMIDTVISEPLLVDDLDRGRSLNTGVAPWKVDTDAAVVVVDYESENMQGTHDASVSWIGTSSTLARNKTNTVFTLSFRMQQPDTVVIALMFRATGATTINMVSPGMLPVNIYKRDSPNADQMGGTSRAQPDSCTASISLVTGTHALVVAIESGINRPSIFWAQGTLGGGIPGNIG